MKKIVIFIQLIGLSIYFSSCVYLFQGKLEIQVLANKTPLQNAQLDLYGIKNNKEIFIQHFVSNSKGQVDTTLNFSQYDKLKLIASKQSLDEILLPKINYFQIPHWWQEQKLNLNIELISPKPILNANAPQANVESLETKPILNEKSEKKEIINLSEIEKSIEEIPVETQTSNSLKKAFPQSPKINQTPLPLTEPPIKIELTKTETKKIQERFLNINVQTENKPVPNAFLYAGYNISKVLQYIGKTNDNGDLKIKQTSIMLPNLLFIKKDEYNSILTPYINNSGIKPIQIDLKSGHSIDLIVESYAYDFGRGLDGAELFFNNAKQSVSTPFGLLTLQQELKPTDNIAIDIPTSSTSKITSQEILDQIEKSKNSIPTFNITSLLPYKPIIGLIEPPLSGALETNLIWRRARREFFSRFINEQIFTTKIMDDLFKITQLNYEQLNEKIKTGWMDTEYAKDLDFILKIDFLENEDNPKFQLQLYNKNGLLLLTQKKTFLENDAEKIASILYNLLLNQLPLEGSVLEFKNKQYKINLGKKQNLHKGDIFAAYVGINKFASPNTPAGILKVLDVLDTSAQCEAISGKIKLEKATNIRIVRSHQPDK